MTDKPSEPQVVPKIGAGVRDDRPPVTDAAGATLKRIMRIPTTVESPAEKHEREMDGDKHKFARRLIWGMVVAVILCGAAMYFAPIINADASVPDGMIDFFKLVATTALGFLFGRSVRNGGK